MDEEERRAIAEAEALELAGSEGESATTADDVDMTAASASEGE